MLPRLDRFTPLIASDCRQAGISPWKPARQPASTSCTAAAPTIGSAGTAQLRRMEDEGPRLRAADPAVERDQLLEGATRIHVGLVEAADHQVGDVREPVGAQQVLRGVRREVRERIVTLDTTVGR